MTNPLITDKDLRVFLAGQLAVSRRAFRVPRMTGFAAGYIVAERETLAALQHVRNLKRWQRAARRESRR